MPITSNPGAYRPGLGAYRPGLPPIPQAPFDPNNPFYQPGNNYNTAWPLFAESEVGRSVQQREQGATFARFLADKGFGGMDDRSSLARG